MCVYVCVWPGWVTAQSPWPYAVARRQSAIRKSSAELEPDQFHHHPYLHGLLFGDLFRIKGEYTRHGEGGREKEGREGGGPPPSTNPLHYLKPTFSPCISFFCASHFTYIQAAISICSYTVICLLPPLIPYTTHTTHTHTHTHTHTFHFAFRFTFVTNGAQSPACRSQANIHLWLFLVFSTCILTFYIFYKSIFLLDYLNYISSVCFV